MGERTAIVTRVRGLRSRQRLRVSWRAAFFTGGKAIWCLVSVMACIFWMKGSAEKGVCPCTIWYRMQPRLQMSEARPTCVGPNTMPGAIHRHHSY